MTRQFKHCHATICEFDTPKGSYKIFYSYQCPKLLEIDLKDGAGTQILQFTYENSRFLGRITESKTTTKQCNQRLGYKYRTLEEINLEKFEKLYYSTILDFYY